MGGKKKKRIDTRNDKRLDVMLGQIETDKKKKTISNVENITQEILTKKKEPKLRLNK